MIFDKIDIFDIIHTELVEHKQCGLTTNIEREGS